LFGLNGSTGKKFTLKPADWMTDSFGDVFCGSVAKTHLFKLMEFNKIEFLQRGYLILR